MIMRCRASMIAGAVLLLLAIPVATPHGLSVATAAGGDTSDPGSCEPYRLSKILRILPNGQQVELPGPVSLQDAIAAARLDYQDGRAYQFELNGTVLQRMIPPKGWTPLSASDEQLRIYGIPSRTMVVDGTVVPVEHWLEDYGHLTFPEPSEPCSSDQSSTGYLTSSNWAGGFSTGAKNYYYTTTMKWTQPTFVAVCPTASRYSIWTGTGGWNGSGLLQNGTDVDGSTLNGAHFWWEAVGTGSDGSTFGVTEQLVDSHITASAGDTLQATNFYYFPGGTPTEEFDWQNLTTGKAYTVNVTDAAARKINVYYAGDTADFITEAPGQGLSTKLYQLRKPSAGYTRIPFAIANETAISHFPGSQIDEKNAAGQYMQDSNFNGVNAWNDTWKSCS